MVNDKYERLKLKNQICFPIYLCSKEIIRRHNQYLAEFNLTYTQFIVMMYFWEKKTSNLKDLAKTMMIDPSTLTPLLKKIEKKGYIKRVRSKEDERNLVITLTESGEELRDKVLGIPELLKNCIDMSDEELEQLYVLIKKMLLNLE